MRSSGRIPAIAMAACFMSSLVVVAAPPGPAIAGDPGARPGSADPAAIAPRHIDVAAAADAARTHPRANPPKPVHALPTPKATQGGARGGAPKAAGPVPIARTTATVPATSAPISGPPYTAIFLDGAPGSSYFDDEIDTYTPANATFIAQVSNDFGPNDGALVFLEGDGANGAYEVEFVGPDKSTLTTGTFSNAVFPPNATTGQAGMFVAAHNVVCSNGSGTFTITDLAFTGTTLTSLAASFSWGCAGGDPGIIGEVRYQSAVGLSAMRVHPSPAPLGNLPVGRTFSSPITIENSGTTAIHLSGFSASGTASSIAIGSNSCGATLLAGANCVVGLSVTPPGVIPIAGALSWTDDSIRGSHAVYVSASGVLEVDTSVAGGQAGSAIDLYLTNLTSPTATCTASCAYDVGVVGGLTVRAVARPPAGATFTGWSGDCTGRAPCILTMSTSRSVTATFAPILASGIAGLRVPNGQAGYRDGEFGCALVPCLEPPDPVVAASPSQVVSASNGTIRVRDRAGTLKADLPIWAFFLEPDDSVYDGDPQVVWDPTHARWLASEFSASCTTGHLHVAISDGADASAGWSVYSLSESGTLLDFPGLGLSSDKVAIGANAYDINSVNCDIQAFERSTLYVLPLAAMLAAGSLTSTSLSSSDVTTFRPAVVLDGTANLPVVLNEGLNGGPLTDVGYLVVTGAGSSTVFGPIYDLSEASNLPPLQFGSPLAAAADPPQPAGFPAASAPVIDGRPLGVAVKAGDLWFTSNIPCTPPADGTARACARVTRVHLRAGFTARASGGLLTDLAALWLFNDSTSAALRFEVREKPGDFPTQERAAIRYGAPGVSGPVMFWLCPPPGALDFCPMGSWGGSLKSANFVASAQVASYAAAVAAIQAGNAYLELYEDFGGSTADHVRGQIRGSSIADQLVFDDLIGKVGTDTFNPAIGFSTDGTQYLTATQTNAGVAIRTIVASAPTGTANGTFAAPAVISRGEATYKGARWGDYSSVAGDPADAHGVWVSQEYVTANGSWQAWASRVVAGASGPPTGTITIDGGASSTADPRVLLDLESAAGAAATEALVSDSPTVSGGLLAKRRYVPLGRDSRWSLIDAAVGGVATIGTKTVYVQFGNGLGTWGAVKSASITLVASPSVVRYSGTDRYSTSAAISAGSFKPGVATAFIATGTNFPDALAGAAVAGRIGAPVLLVTPTTIPAATKAELTRLKPDRLVILGGTGAVSAGVEAGLAPYAPGGVFRISGANRYETAANIAYNYFTPGPAITFIATGTNFPDALAGAAAAGARGSPILLVAPTAIPTATARALAYLHPGRIVILGGTGAVSGAVATQLHAYTAGTVSRLAGTDRYGTAAAISRAFFAPGVSGAFVATGLNFPDALSGAPVAGWFGNPVILVSPKFIPIAADVELQRLDPKRIVILGGTGAVSSAVALELGGYVVP